jgi:hypothetical protein
MILLSKQVIRKRGPMENLWQAVCSLLRLVDPDMKKKGLRQED